MHSWTINLVLAIAAAAPANAQGQPTWSSPKAECPTNAASSSAQPGTGSRPAWSATAASYTAPLETDLAAKAPVPKAEAKTKSGSQDAPLPLAPPISSNRIDPTKRATGVSSAITVVTSLAIVLGLFLLVAWGMRKAAPRGQIHLPQEAFQMLGRAPLSGRQQVHLLRCGSKLLLVSVTPAGAETLTEITDPAEVDRLAGLCQQTQSSSATAAFRQILHNLTKRQAAGDDLVETRHDRSRDREARHV